jgi:Cof subfamily protein (haloacid dehalogenase superfamily)
LSYFFLAHSFIEALYQVFYFNLPYKEDRAMKLFVTDIDNTLSVGETVSSEVQSACKRLRNAGWEIMIATGRTFRTAKRHMTAASATQPAILCDGSRVMSLEGGEIHSTLFDPAAAKILLEYLWSLPAEIQITGGECVHCRESDVETVAFYREAGAPVYFITAPSPPTPIYCIALWIRPEKLTSIEDQLRNLFGNLVEITSGGDCFLNILPKGVSKGSALEYFISTLPRRPEVIVASGDHDNDMTMLACADVAAIPRDASGKLLPLADIIIPTANQNGISALIEHILSPAFSHKGKPLKKGEPLPL